MVKKYIVVQYLFPKFRFPIFPFFFLFVFRFFLFFLFFPFSFPVFLLSFLSSRAGNARANQEPPCRPRASPSQRRVPGVGPATDSVSAPSSSHLARVQVTAQPQPSVPSRDLNPEAESRSRTNSNVKPILSTRKSSRAETEGTYHTETRGNAADLKK